MLNKCKICTIIECALIFIGLFLLFWCIPHSICSDGFIRYEALNKLLLYGQIPKMKYSIIGSLFAVPFYLLGKIFKSPSWWCARYNFFIFILGLFLFYKLLRNHVEISIIRKFLLLLIYASMFPCHLKYFFGEVFTAVLVSIGILEVIANNSSFGWFLVILGVVNTPASLVGLTFVVTYKSFKNKKWRYFLILGAAILLYLIENWLRKGGFFVSGYHNDHGFKTIMPYSGLPGFSYPFFFGLISILFSFGKGILFYAPSIFLPMKNYISQIGQKVYESYKLWIIFLIGLILVYSKWWAWYGGWFWGPRFFLFASIPASFALALHIHQISKREVSFVELVIILVVSSLSFWVGINGAVFDQVGLEQIGVANNYALEALCWYTPEFSALWYPFVHCKRLNYDDVIIIIFSLLTYLYLTLPAWQQLIVKGITKAKEFKQEYLCFHYWRF